MKLDLQRYIDYLNTSSEDWDARAQIGITDTEEEQLHRWMLEGVLSASTYRLIRLGRIADHIYSREAKRKGWTISLLRKQLSEGGTRRYIQGNEEIFEENSYAFWPCYERIFRIRKTLPIPSNMKFQVELRNLVWNNDFNAQWKSVCRGLEEEAVLLSQWVMQNGMAQDVRERLWEMVYLPPAHISYCVKLSQGVNCKTHTFPLRQRYHKKLRDAAERYRFVPDKAVVPNRPYGSHGSDELAEAEAAFLQGIKDYRPANAISPVTWLVDQINWKMGDIFDRQSLPDSRSAEGPVDSHSISDSRKQPRMKRILVSRVEWSGGSLDEQVAGQRTGEDGLALHEILSDPRPTRLEKYERDELHEQQEKALAKLREELGHAFYTMCLEERSTDDIAVQLGKTKAATYKQFERAMDSVRRHLGLSKTKKPRSKIL